MKNAQKRKLTAISATLLATSSIASAAQAEDTGFYASIGAGYATSNVDKIELVETGAGLVILRGGYNFNKYLGVEGEGSFTAIKPGIDPTGVNRRDAALHHGQSFGGFFVARYPVMENADMFVRGGFHHTRLTGRAPDFRQTRSANNVAFGGGVAYHWGRNSIRVDYTVYNITREHFDQRVATVSLARGF